MEWVKCSDRMPEIKDKTQRSSESDDVLIIDSSGQMYVGYLNYYGISGYRKEEGYSWSEQSTACVCCCQELHITHWMPLPPTPKD